MIHSKISVKRGDIVFSLRYEDFHLYKVIHMSCTLAEYLKDWIGADYDLCIGKNKPHTSPWGEQRIETPRLLVLPWKDFNNTLKRYREKKQSRGILSWSESPCSAPHFEDKETDLENFSDLSKVIFVIAIRATAKTQPGFLTLNGVLFYYVLQRGQNSPCVQLSPSTCSLYIWR